MRVDRSFRRELSGFEIWFIYDENSFKIQMLIILHP
jgi:hypothetical protein